MRFFRSERVESLIQGELGKILSRELEFGGALVTIMAVDVDKKLERAKVRVSVIPAAAERTALHELEIAAGRLQHLLMKKINIKPMPHIMFVSDHGAENAAAVEKVFLEHDGLAPEADGSGEGEATAE